MKPLPPGLAIRDAISEHDHVASRLVAAGSDERAPFVTVAIPTFGRPDLLVDTVKSALAQDFDRPFEILIVDNDPDSQGAEELLEAIPELRERSFRYFVNAENIGMYPNHNRCLQLARGEWLTILNDDDLFLPHFLSTMFKEFDRRPDIKGMVSRKRMMEEREVGAAPPASLPFRIGYRLWLESFFVGRNVRRIPLSTLFWATVAGNLVGFVCRRDAAIAVGGFYPEDQFSADYWFYTRFAAVHGLYKHRDVLVLIRIARNTLMRADVLRSLIAQGVRMRQAVVGYSVPRAYARLGPMFIAHEQNFYEQYWGVKVPREDLEREYGKLPPNRPLLYHALRMLHRAY